MGLPTSVTAAAKATDPTRLGRLQLRVLRNLDDAGEDGLTDFEHGFQQTSAGKRRLELLRVGLVEQAGDRTRTNVWGNPAQVWTITADGHAAVEARTMSLQLFRCPECGNSIGALGGKVASCPPSTLHKRPKLWVRMVAVNELDLAAAAEVDDITRQAYMP